MTMVIAPRSPSCIIRGWHFEWCSCWESDWVREFCFFQLFWKTFSHFFLCFPSSKSSNIVGGRIIDSFKKKKENLIFNISHLFIPLLFVWEREKPPLFSPRNMRTFSPFLRIRGDRQNVFLTFFFSYFNSLYLQCYFSLLRFTLSRFHYSSFFLCVWGCLQNLLCEEKEVKYHVFVFCKCEAKMKELF